MHQSKIIITDTHFGKKNNSMQFLKSQLTELHKLINYIYKLPNNSQFDLVHLGDVFDSRSTVSINVLHEVTKILQDLNTAVKSKDPANRMIFVAGNHDFFSPQSDSICSLTTFINKILPDAVMIDKEVWQDDDDLYVPWFVWDEHRETINFNNIKRVFTHADLHGPQYDDRVPQGVMVYAGHIHTLHTYRDNRMVNLSPPYSMDFGDANDDKKGFWTLNDVQLQLHKNTTSIKFRKLTNDEIFDIPDYEESINRGDNYNILIDSENQTKKEYIERINEMRENFKYINVLPIIHITEEDDSNVNISDINIEKILKDKLPESLKPKFDKVLESINEEERL